MQRRQLIHGPYKHGNRWRCVLPGGGEDGKTGYRSFATRALADAYKASATDEAQGTTVSETIAAFIDAKRAQGRAELTLVAYEQRLRLLLADYLERPVRSVAHRGAELYESAIAGRRADSHQNLLVAGRLWGKWCVKRRLLKEDPFAEVEAVGQRVHGGDKDRLTIDESRQLEAWCLDHPADAGALLTMTYLYLGARNTELGRRDVRDLDDDGHLLWIGRTKTRSGRRKLRVPEVLRALLVASCAGRHSTAPLFMDARGNRLTRNTARDLVRATCAAAGVPVLPPQALRRTHAALANAAGETGYAVARALGHSTGDAPKVTIRSYIGRDVADQARATAAMEALRGNRVENSEPN